MRAHLATVFLTGVQSVAQTVSSEKNPEKKQPDLSRWEVQKRLVQKVFLYIDPHHLTDLLLGNCSEACCVCVRVCV